VRRANRWDCLACGQVSIVRAGDPAYLFCERCRSGHPSLGVLSDARPPNRRRRLRRWLGILDDD
jgi:hypothetical protein